MTLCSRFNRLGGLRRLAVWWCAVAFGVVGAGCGGNPYVRLPFVVKFDSYNEVLVGDVLADRRTGRETILAKAQVSGFQCDGVGQVLHIPARSLVGSCSGQTGTVNLRCSDGRVFNGHWKAASCGHGTGSGYDQDGVRIAFTYGMSPAEMPEAVDEAKTAVATNPALPVYEPKEVRKQIGYSTGTGFFVSADGDVITNFHVVEDSSNISVVWNGRTLPATVLKLDPANDVAMLKIDAVTPALRVSNSHLVQKGEDVLTLGYPLLAIAGQEQKASFGRVNALSGIRGDIRFLQIDGPIQPGNSGGPLMDRSGMVVGIVTETLNQLVTLRASGSLPQNMNYAVKGDYIVPLLGVIPNIAPESMPLKDFAVVVKASENSVVLVIAK